MDLDPSVPDFDEAAFGDFAPWDGRRVPVTLIGGYLGAGKTTLLNNLLAQTDRPIAVVVNDVGAVNIDQRLVAKRHGDTLELTDGCMCCELNEGLNVLFDRLTARPTPPEHLVVELSGVADPGPVKPWANSPGFRLDGVIVLADVEQIEERLADPLVGDLVRRQLDEADLVVLTKTDLVTTQRVRDATDVLRAIAPDRPYLASSDPEALAGLLTTATRRPGGVTDVPNPSLFDAHEVSTVPLPRPASDQAINELLDQLANDAHAGPLVRAKGVAEGPDGQRRLIQVVGRRRMIVDLPEAEDQQPTDLVVIRIGGRRRISLAG
jgi:G3E family GTPase